MWKSFTYKRILRTFWTHPAFGHIFVPPTSRHLGTGGQDDNLTHNFVLKQRDSGPKRGDELQLLQRCAHFSLRGWVDGLVRAHVELWIKHVLDQTTELQEAVGLQIVQGDVVQRRDLHQNNNGSYLCAKQILPFFFSTANPGMYTATLPQHAYPPSAYLWKTPPLSAPIRRLFQSGQQLKTAIKTDKCDLYKSSFLITKNVSTAVK